MTAERRRTLRSYPGGSFAVALAVLLAAPAVLAEEPAEGEAKAEIPAEPGFITLQQIPEHGCDSDFEAPMRIVANGAALTIDGKTVAGPAERVVRIRRGSEIEEKVIATGSSGAPLPAGIDADFDFVLCISPFLGPFTKFGGGTVRLEMDDLPMPLVNAVSDLPAFQFSGFEHADLLGSGLVDTSGERIARIHFQLPETSWRARAEEANPDLVGAVLKVAIRLSPLTEAAVAEEIAQ